LGESKEALCRVRGGEVARRREEESWQAEELEISGWDAGGGGRGVPSAALADSAARGREV